MGKANAPARCDKRAACRLILSIVHATNEDVVS